MAKVNGMHLEGGIVDLQQLSLSPGQARALDLEVALAPIELGGQTYVPAGGRGGGAA